jgi:hypothetical protein
MISAQPTFTEHHHLPTPSITLADQNLELALPQNSERSTAANRCYNSLVSATIFNSFIAFSWTSSNTFCPFRMHQPNEYRCHNQETEQISSVGVILIAPSLSGISSSLHDCLLVSLLCISTQKDSIDKRSSDVLSRMVFLLITSKFIRHHPPSSASSTRNTKEGPMALHSNAGARKLMFILQHLYM